MSFATLQSDGSAAGTGFVAPEERAIQGEETWWAPVSGAGIAVTQKTALGLSAYLAGITVLSTDLAALPLKVYRRTSKGREEQPKHPVHELMCRTPDGERTPIAWRRSWIAHALEIGSGYAEIERTGRGAPSGLHLLNPEGTYAQRVEGRLGYRLSNGRWLPATNVLHIAGLGWDGLTGYNPLHLQSETLGLGLAAQSFASDHFANGSEPGGALEIPHKLKDQAAVNRLRDGWENRHGGPGRRHRVAVLEEGAKFNPISTDPEKSQLVETRKFQVLEAIRALRVPPNKVGDYSQSHLANLEAANLDYLMTALLGWLETMEQELNLKLFTRQEWLDGYYVEHNVDALLRGDIKTRFAAYAQAVGGGWMSRNEVRARENMNPISSQDGGDLYTVQSQNIPLGQSGNGAEPAPADAPKPTPEPAEPTAPTDAPVANTALNGAQIASLLDITNAVTAGTIPIDTAKGLILASFPNLTEAQVDAILAPLEGFTPASQEPASPDPEPTQEEPADADEATPPDA